MKRLCLALTSALLLIPTCLADTCSLTTTHCYKEKVALDNGLFDPTMDCGLDLSRIEGCIKADRSKGTGDSFCNDVKLYAGNKQKLMQMNNSIRENPSSKATHMPMIKLLNDVQTKFTHQFVDAGLKPEEIANIPSITNFVCKKRERMAD